jgi:hypothetical protein
MMVIHGPLPFPGADERSRRPEALGRTQLDGPFELRHLQGDERFDLGESLRLGRTVGGQIAEIVERRGQRGDRVSVRLEEGRVGGDDEPSLARLGVLHEAEDVRQVLEVHVCARDRVARPRERRDALVADDPHPHEEHECQREPCCHFFSERPHVFSAP